VLLLEALIEIVIQCVFEWLCFGGARHRTSLLGETWLERRLRWRASRIGIGVILLVIALAALLFALIQNR
jgi:hypothetical protein